MDTIVKNIDCSQLSRMIISGAGAIENNKEKLNDLNVFPVPDGDTGSNMALTVQAAAKSLSERAYQSVSEVSERAAKSMLKGARGNSGVITSLLFRGMATALKDADICTPELLAEALQSGVAAAYKAVASPAEGTILTVARLAADAAIKAANDGKNISGVFEDTIASAKLALEATRTMNPVLQKAGVVDAGGYGWVLILEAMSLSFEGRDTVSAVKNEATSKDSADFASFNEEDITFTYCTEFIISRTNQNDARFLKSELEKMGDSLVLVDDDELIKVHVHTDDPGTALHLAIEYGQFVSVKVENMRLQHSSIVQEATAAVSAPSEISEEYGVVAVSPGDGITEIFTALGVDFTVSGGQTMNPSTEDILDAINKVCAKTVLVLPNNKNIILAAEQAKALCEKNVIVIPSKTVPQGVCAMQSYDTDLDEAELVSGMETALANVDTMQITTAVRDSDMNGLNIKKDDYIALYNGELIAGNPDEGEIVDLLIKRIGERDIITIYYGADVDEAAAEAVYAKFANAFTDDNVSLINGAQSVYRYIISAE